jgi:hypothetical protein
LLCVPVGSFAEQRGPVGGPVGGRLHGGQLRKRGRDLVAQLAATTGKVRGEVVVPANGSVQR